MKEINLGLVAVLMFCLCACNPHDEGGEYYTFIDMPRRNDICPDTKFNNTNALSSGNGNRNPVSHAYLPIGKR